MAGIAPPYLNKLIEKCKKDVIKAERNELKAKKKYEYSQEYTALCKAQLQKVKDENK